MPNAWFGDRSRPGRRGFLLGTALAVATGAVGASTVSARAAASPLRIGVLNDQSGDYADIEGKGSVVAARMAVEDFGGSVLGRPIEILTGDHQNKPDVGSTIVRKWFDVEGVEMVAEVGHSAVALAVQEIAREKNKLVIYGAVGTTEITQRACSPNGIAWLYDARALASGPPHALVKQGLDTWFFLTVNFNFGHATQAEVTKAVNASGGKVVGSALFPQFTADFSSYLLQAQASKAKVISFIASGSDNINGLKQAREFGLMDSGIAITVPLLWITDVRSMGLELAQGLTFIETFYWDRNDETRAWSKRFFDRHGAMPTGTQASAYSGIFQYLKAVAAAGSSETRPVIDKLRSMPLNDVFVKNGWIRDDMRLMHDFYLAQVKKPAESKGPWDYYNLLQTIPPEVAFAPLSESLCPLVKK